MRCLVAAVSVAMALATVLAFAAFASDTTGGDGGVTPNMESSVRRWFNDTLFERREVHYRFERLATDERGRRWVCGTVIGRRRFSRFGGQQHFAALLGQDDRAVMGWAAEYGTEDWAAEVAPHCGR